MNPLQTILFGRVRATHDNWLTEIKLTRGLQALLAYLLLYRNSMHTREVLAGVFWGEYNQERARNCLNTALWRLRNLLEPEGIPDGTYLVGSHSDEVSFNLSSRYWLDVDVFEVQISRILAYPVHIVNETDIQEFEHTLQLYKGDLLEGFYEDWVLRERERLRSLYIKGLRYLLQYDKYQCLYEKGLSHAQQILDLDPLKEDIHREMMRLYLASGQRAQAARQYKICWKILADELNIPPMDETQALYEQILTESGNNLLPYSAVMPDSLEQARQQLSQATQAMNLAYEKISQAVKCIEKYTESQDFIISLDESKLQEKLDVMS